jgi:hydroxymethylglutaryl-CoA lyase
MTDRSRAGSLHRGIFEDFRQLQQVNPMSLPSQVRLIEVGPRDGLQNEAQPISVADKVQLVDALSAAGLAI